jgi:hypothetical protein
VSKKSTNNAENEVVFEDISSSSPADKRKKQLKKAVKAVDNYGDGAARNIDKVIKAISFIVAIGVFLVFAAIAAVLYLLDPMFTIVAIGVLVLGVVFALIFLFLIYGLGHIITQNKEILKRLY